MKMNGLYKFIYLIIILYCIFAAELYADVYSWVDENGVKHYSNTPPPEKVDYTEKKEIQSSHNDTETTDSANRIPTDDAAVDQFLKETKEKRQKAKEKQIKQVKCESAKAWLAHVQQKTLKEYLKAVVNNEDYGNRRGGKHGLVDRNIQNRNKAQRWQRQELDWANRKVACECHGGNCRLGPPLHAKYPELKN